MVVSVRCCAFLLLALAALSSFPVMTGAATTPTDVLTEIQLALANKQDLSYVLKYLDLSRTELLANLPTLKPDGTKNSFSFFAPKNWGFIRLLPQDTFDPFFVDAQFRRDVLLRHFVLHRVTDDEIATKNELIMADQKHTKLTRESNVTRINDATIDLNSIQLGNGMGVVYIIDRVFTTHQDIEEILNKHPVKETPWGPIDSSNNVNNNQQVESQTVVVDVIAEFLNTQ